MIEVSRDGVSIRSDVVCNVIQLSAQCSVLARCYQAASRPADGPATTAFYGRGESGGGEGEGV